jgi:hypothetical protein
LGVAPSIVSKAFWRLLMMMDKAAWPLLILSSLLLAPAGTDSLALRVFSFADVVG